MNVWILCALNHFKDLESVFCFLFCKANAYHSCWTGYSNCTGIDPLFGPTSAIVSDGLVSSYLESLFFYYRAARPNFLQVRLPTRQCKIMITRGKYTLSSARSHDRCHILGQKNRAQTRRTNNRYL